MHRLTHYRLLFLCLTGVLLLPLCCGQTVYDDYDDTTQTPDYDYNATFEYIFFSNASTEDLDKFLRASEEEFYEGEDMVEEEDTTFSTTMSTTDSSIAKGSRTAPPCLLLALALTVHQLGQLL
uniref:Si:ch211-191i18.2 n=1 Tax=Oncorhynchus kisutch TaxID=8019 RepID=A0A8C7FP41_ONCKI